MVEGTYVIIHSNTPIADSTKATNINGSPIRNPSGLQFSQHILPHLSKTSKISKLSKLLEFFNLLSLIYNHAR